MSFVTDRIPLNDVLILDLDKEQVNPSGLYEMVGVLSYGKGLFNKDEVCGNATSYKTFYKLNKKHIVMSQLFGWEGQLLSLIWNFMANMYHLSFPHLQWMNRDSIGNFWVGGSNSRRFGLS
ncbi:hypothetical protein QYZ43_03040 [Vibrio parahaemolyticus]|nr:hypothetical protein [Vibrio parahaemolyticus]MDN4716954.1 hypothetical protein [Vibrio parahaemolyticus]MDN4724379.1 hypothetical protein [Vibrio parahaemolyticus]